MDGGKTENRLNILLLALFHAAFQLAKAKLVAVVLGLCVNIGFNVAIIEKYKKIRHKYDLLHRSIHDVKRRVKREACKMEKVMEPFGNRLRELRKKNKMTQEEMATFLGMAGRNYQRMEYGFVNVPSLTVIRLADYFHVTTDYLLGRD